MKKRIIATVLTLALFLGVLIALPTFTSAATGWDGTTSAAFSGKGTKNDPYVITNAENLKSLQEQVKAGDNFAGKYIVLANDIDLGGKEWTPIGSVAADQTAFSGVFDGSGFTVKGFSITTVQQYSALFGAVSATDAYDAIIANLTVEGSIVLDNDDELSAQTYIGGIIGWTVSAKPEDRTKVINCTSKVSITINKDTTGTQEPFIGGIVARTYNVDFYDCVNEGAINVNFGGSHGKIVRVGGLAGAYYNSTFTNSRNYGNINVVQSTLGKNLDYVGGFVGAAATSSSTHTSTFTNCANFGNVSAENTVGMRVRSAGFIGSFYANRTTIDNCYNSGNITGIISGTLSGTQFSYVGGFAGYIQKEGGTTTIIIKNSYNNGTILSTGGSGERAGGIAGVFSTDAAYPNKIENCATTTAKVTGHGPYDTSTADISTENFNTLVAPIITAIEAGSTYNFDNAISEVGTPPETTAPVTTAPVTTAPTTTVPTTTVPTTTEADDDTTEPAQTTETPATTEAKKRSCGSSSTTFIALFALLGGTAVFVFTKKKF